MLEVTLPGAWARPPEDAPFLSGPGLPEVTYGEAVRRSAVLSDRLIEAGVAPGDRVVLQVEKSEAVVLVYLACVRRGIVLVPLNPAYTIEESGRLAQEVDPRLIIRQDLLDQLVDGLADEAGADASSPGPVDWPLPGARGPGDGPGLAPEDPAAILFTSGTTGRPKGAVLSHRALASNARTLAEAWAFSPRDVLLHALPLFHTHGLFVALNTVLVGGARLVLLPRFEPELVAEHLSAATVFMGVPTFYARLLATAALDRSVCAGMRLFTSGSAPLAAPLHTAFRRRTGHVIVERYGLTETNILTTNPLGQAQAGTVGRPLPGVELRLTGPGRIGEVEARGPGLASGYWGRPEAWESDLTTDGWFRTGDLGRWDEAGHLVLVGRSKDLVITGGLNVYPGEVEGVLDELEGVAESAVVGVPDPDLGERVVAILAPASGAEVDPEALRRACRSRLAGFKVPKEVVIVTSLPRNAMGKVDKAELRRRLGPSTVGTDQ